MATIGIWLFRIFFLFLSVWYSTWNLAFCNVPWPANTMALLSDSPSTYNYHLDLTLTLLALLKKSFARVNQVFLATISRPNSSWSLFSLWLESWRCSLSVKSFDRRISRAWLFSFSTVEFHSCKRTSTLVIAHRSCHELNVCASFSKSKVDTESLNVMISGGGA